MKNWNTPSVEELEIKLTAYGREPATAEGSGGGFVDGSWVNAVDEHNKDTHEWNGTCAEPIYRIPEKQTTGS